MPGRATNDPTNYFALGRQSGQGNAASTLIYTRHLDGTGFEISEDVESIREGGDGQEIGLRYKTAVSADGNVVVNDRPEIAARLWAWTLGVATQTVMTGNATVASGVAQELIAWPGPTIPYVTAEQFWADEIERVIDAKITQLEVEWEAGRPLKLTGQFIGGGTISFPASPGAPARETMRPFMYTGASITLDGVANTDITKGKITIKRNVDDGIRTNGLNRSDVIEQNFEIDVDLTLKYTDAGLYAKMHAGGAGGSQIPIDLSTTALSIFAVIGAGTTRRHQQIDLPLLDMVGARVNKMDPDGKTMYADLALAGIRSATHQIIARTAIASSAAI